MRTEAVHQAQPLGIVITGGSSGIGYALARGFLAAGDKVVISARDPEKLERAMVSLRQDFPGAVLGGMLCDVRDPGMVSGFASYAARMLGRIDRWINNAGTAGMKKRPLWELDPEDILETGMTNLSGSLLLCAAAVKVMDGQPATEDPSCHIFNMGFSQPGAMLSRSNIPHKASKRGVALITGFLAREFRQAGKTSIGVHELSPGLVLTPLLLRDTPPQTLAVLRLVARTPEEVAAVLVPKIRSISGSGRNVRFRPVMLTALSMFFAFARKRKGRVP